MVFAIREIHRVERHGEHPMTPNWRGLPDIVKWGCSEGFTVNIIPVRYPENLSLGSLSSSELGDIIKHYRSAEINPANDYSKRNKKNFEDYIGFVEQWHQHKKDMEGVSKEAEKLNPADEIRNRFKLSLNITSMTEVEKESQINTAMEKLLRLNKKFENGNPYFKETVWKLAFLSRPRELLTSLLNVDDSSLLALGKIPVGNEIDKLNGGDSEEVTHLKKLKLYLDYCEIAGVNPDECINGFNRWKNHLQHLKSVGNSHYEKLIAAANKSKAATLGDALLEGKEQSILEGWNVDAADRSTV